MDNKMSLLTSPFVPEGMVDLMKKLSKGVIKERPPNIYEYAAGFFEKMLIERDGSLDKGYGKFRSYTEYCKFMDKMDQRRLSQTIKKGDEVADKKDTVDDPPEEVVQLSSIEVQGVAIQGVERKSKDNVKNVSINPKYKSQSEKTAKPVVPSVKNVKKPRKLSSKKPSENLIVIKEETSNDVDDSSNGEPKLHKAAMTIQKAFRMYMHKKSSQGEHSSETFGNVSQLSEDAAAVIIQKAFKSLIRKLKPEAQNREKTAVESNNNIVIPDAGQENAINVDKILNNTDEHSKQILVDDGGTGTKYDSEPTDTIQGDASEDASTNLEIETNEITNIELITALDATGTHQIETEDIMIEGKTSPSDGGNNQVTIASANKDEAGTKEDLALQQKNEPLIQSTTIPLDTQTENEIQEVSDPNGTQLVEQLEDKVAVEKRPTVTEGQPSENETPVSGSENLNSSEAQEKYVSDNPVVENTVNQEETEAIQSVSEEALENKSNSSKEDVGKITSETDQDETDSNVDHSVTVSYSETEIVPSDEKEIVIQVEHTGLADMESTALVTPKGNTSQSAQEEDLNNVNDNIDKNVSSTDNDVTKVNAVESPVKQQLFVVEKDGIYVNMDLLQEKFDIDAINDGTGSDSEKTFKLNILEHEEILVNQENVQQIKDGEVAMNEDIVVKTPAGEIEGKFVDEVESTATSNCDIRDEDGNEEYELAETVVLMDIPSKTHHEGENLLQSVPLEDECVDSMKHNTVNDETDKIDTWAVEKGLERFSDSVKVVDEEVAAATAEVDEVIKNEAAVVEHKIIGHRSNKTEPESISNIEGDLVNEYDSEEKTKLKDRTNENESTAPTSVDTVKTEVAVKEEYIKNESKKVQSQPNQIELPESHSDKIVEIVEIVEKEQTIDENVGHQSNISELPTTHSGVLKEGNTWDEKLEHKLNINKLSSSHTEKVESVIEGEESTNDIESTLDNNETQESEMIVKREVGLNVEEAMHKNAESQCKDTELTVSNSEKIVKLQGEEAKNENVDSPASKSELTAHESEKIVKVEAVSNVKEAKNENTDTQCNEIELTASNSEKNVKLEDEYNKNEEKILKVEHEETENQSPLNKSELTSSDLVNIVEVEDGEEIETKNVDDQLNGNELQATDSGKIVKLAAVLEDDETKNEKVVSQLNTVEPESTLSNCETKEIESDNAKHNKEQPDGQLCEDSSASLQVKGETNEPVIKSENQLQGKDVENIVESESKINDGTDDEKEKIENVLQENLTTALTSEKIDLPTTENESVKTDTEADSSNQTVRGKENEELVKAATIIQKVFRGYIVRNSASVNPNSKKQQHELWAALVIQKYARGYLVRRNMQRIDQIASKEIKNDETDTNRTDDNSTTDVVAQLPAYSNRFLIPKDSFLERESFADDEDYARTCKELAATSIQKTYRGYRVRRSLKASSEKDTETDGVRQEDESGIELSACNDQVQTAVTEAERVITDVLNVAADVLPSDTYDMDSFEDEVTDEKNVELDPPEISSKTVDHASVLGQAVHDNLHVEGQMQQKYNQIKFQGSAINPIEEMSDSSEQPETPPEKSAQNSAVKSKTIESDSLDSKDYDGSKSFSYEQLSSDLSDTDENKRESMKESEVDETSRDERDDLSEVENFDLSSCGEDSLEAMYYSLRKNEIMVDRMQKQVAEQREPKNDELKCAPSENLKVEFPERVTENLDVAMQQVFKSMESSSDYDVGKKDEDDNSSTLDLALDDNSSINDEKEVETSRHIKPTEEVNLEDSEQSESTNTHHDNAVSQSPEPNMDIETETSNAEQSQQSDSSVNSSTRFIMKSQSVSEDMMNPIMYAMKRKQVLLDQLHVRPYPLQENLSEDHDAFPEHLLTDIDIGNIQRKIFASSVSETDSDYVEPNTTGRRLVRDDFNISTALDHLSTDSDSTIISAATKIQAGARGFLTRRRLRRSSAGGTTSISFEKRYSFGNAAIDKSLEDLIKMQEQINLDGAALKIQQQYRRYQARKNNLKKVSPIREQTTLELSGGSSVEGNEGTDDIVGIKEITFAQKKAYECQENVEETMKSHLISLNIDTVENVEAVKKTPVNQRRLTLQRGDAVQRNSRPDSQDSNIVKDGDGSSSHNQSNEKFKDSETGEYIDGTNSKKEKKGIGPRQRSMPVQIDSELMRIIPKHLRKRVKSADMAKKRSG